MLWNNKFISLVYTTTLKVSHRNLNFLHTSDRPDAKLILEPIRLEHGFFFTRDTKFWRRIVSENSYDGRLYHQAGGNSPNAKCHLLPFTDIYGSTT